MSSRTRDSEARANPRAVEAEAPAARKNERLDVRVLVEHKDLIERAAAALGQTVSAFLIGLALPRAREVVRDCEALTLSGRDRELFLAAIDDADAEPNDALRRAAEKYKAALG